MSRISFFKRAPPRHDFRALLGVGLMALALAPLGLDADPRPFEHGDKGGFLELRASCGSFTPTVGQQLARVRNR